MLESIILVREPTFDIKPDDIVDEMGWREVTSLFKTLHLQLLELSEYSSSLGNGNLDVDYPPKKNYLTSGLKLLHSNLQHLTWKVGEISRGNYNQKVSFMGDFSTYFNNMTEKLKRREEQVAESRKLLEAILSYSDLNIYVIDAQTGAVIFAKTKNQSFSDEKRKAIQNDVINVLVDKFKNSAEKEIDWNFFSKHENTWYKTKSMKIDWTDTSEAYFNMLLDISEEREVQEELKKATLIDVKTGVYNTAYAMNALKSLLSHSEAFTLCFFDIDLLKQTNDTLGHAIGDKLISSFVNVVMSVIRENDSFCRIGGDEFLLILPQTDEKDSCKIIDRIMKKADDINKTGENEFEISFSYGNETVEAGDDPASPQDIIDRADNKMYIYKKEKKANLLKNKKTPNPVKTQLNIAPRPDEPPKNETPKTLKTQQNIWPKR
jgi:diguanylate cyclase (GGDEF)-like protein